MLSRALRLRRKLAATVTQSCAKHPAQGPMVWRVRHGGARHGIGGVSPPLRRPGGPWPRPCARASPALPQAQARGRCSLIFFFALAMTHVRRVPVAFFAFHRLSDTVLSDGRSLSPLLAITVPVYLSLLHQVFICFTPPS